MNVEGLGTIYLADPVCDDVNVSLQLELYVITFHSEYYSTSQGSSPASTSSCLTNHHHHIGRKKLKQVEAEIQRLASIRHPNHTSVFAVKLTGVGGGYGYSYSSYLAGGASLIGGHGTGTGRPQLMVLSEQTPTLTLYDMLQDCDCLKDDRARVGHSFFFFLSQSDRGLD